MIFLDNASTTKIYEESLNVFNEINLNNYFNPSALYKPAVKVSNLIYNARKQLLNLLGASNFDDFVFTSGATESNNYAIKGILRKNMGKLVFSQGEHPAVYNMAKELLNQGYNVEFVNLKIDGTIDECDFKNKIKNASFVSVIHVNNETGAINDIKKLVSIAKQESKDIVFYSDGVQAFGKIRVNVADLGVDLYTISSHKIHGPKGLGALYIKNNIKLKPFIVGGGQENGNRAGTENTSGIMAFCKSAEIIISNLKENFRKIEILNELFINQMKENITNFVLNSSRDNNSPYIISFSLLGIKAETILHMLEEYDIYIGTGSACSSKKTENRILFSMGIKNDIISSSVRVSFNEFNTSAEITKVVNAFVEINKNYISKIK